MMTFMWTSGLQSINGGTAWRPDQVVGAQIEPQKTGKRTAGKVGRPGIPPGSRMTPQGPAMGPPGYGTSPVSRPGMPQSVMDQSRKRPAPQQIQQVQQAAQNRNQQELVPESQAYMDLLAFERKLDQTIMRKRLDIQEALKRPIKQKRKLRIFISNTFNPAKPDAEDGEGTVASWELRVEGRLLEDTAVSKYDATKQKRKFSSFFKSLVIELDKDLYGPDNHLVEASRGGLSVLHEVLCFR
ncbi:SMRD1 regulator, partial [Polypterus senegalus]